MSKEIPVAKNEQFDYATNMRCRAISFVRTVCAVNECGRLVEEIAKFLPHENWELLRELVRKIDFLFCTLMREKTLSDVLQQQVNNLEEPVELLHKKLKAETDESNE